MMEVEALGLSSRQLFLVAANWSSASGRLYQLLMAFRVISDAECGMGLG